MKAVGFTNTNIFIGKHYNTKSLSHRDFAEWFNFAYSYKVKPGLHVAV